jgi:formylglycine-generating enzyme required for sulfatase activity
LSGKRFPWGDTITHSQANYYSSSSYSYDVSPTRNYHPTYAIGSRPYTSPVGSFAANGYGLYDMAGNVRERCWDWYGTYATGAQTDPRGLASGTSRVSRGGSWNNNADYCRVAGRNDYYASGTGDLIGFRVARSSVP